VLQRGDAGGIVAAIFEALERIDHLWRGRLMADDADYAAHRLRVTPARLLTVKALLFHNPQRYRNKGHSTSRPEFQNGT
jgi:hypothetical protein